MPSENTATVKNAIHNSQATFQASFDPANRMVSASTMCYVLSNLALQVHTQHSQPAYAGDTHPNEQTCTFTSEVLRSLRSFMLVFTNFAREEKGEAYSAGQWL